MDESPPEGGPPTAKQLDLIADNLLRKLSDIEAKLASVEENVRNCAARLPPPGALEAAANALQGPSESDRVRELAAHVERLERELADFRMHVRGY